MEWQMVLNNVQLGLSKKSTIQNVIKFDGSTSSFFYFDFNLI